MATTAFSRTVVTDDGLDILSRADAGLIRIVWTRIVTSSTDISALTDTEIQALTELQGEEQEKRPDGIVVTKNDDGTNQVRIRALITNTTVETGYDLYAYGLYAAPENDPVDGQKLVAVSTIPTGDLPVPIPPASQQYGISVQPEFLIAVNRVSQINLSVDPAGSVTQEDLQNLRDLVTGVNYPNQIFVNPNNFNEVQNGSVTYPVQTIQEALELARQYKEADPSSKINIVLSPATYNTDLVLTSLDNILISAPTSNLQESLVEIDGDVVIDMDCENIGLQNIYFSGNFTNNSEIGNIYVTGCEFNSYTSGSESDGRVLLEFCTIIHNATINGTANIYFRFCDFGSTGLFIMNTIGTKVEFYGCHDVAGDHHAGQLIINGNTHIKKGSNRVYAIDSDASGLANSLLLFSGTTLQDDGSYALIRQSDSNCYYALTLFIHNGIEEDGTGDIFNGSRIGAGVQLRDIYDRSGYSYQAISVPAEPTALEIVHALDQALAGNYDLLVQILSNTNTILTRLSNLQTTANSIQSTVNAIDRSLAGGIAKAYYYFSVRPTLNSGIYEVEIPNWDPDYKYIISTLPITLSATTVYNGSISNRSESGYIQSITDNGRVQIVPGSWYTSSGVNNIQTMVFSILCF